MKTARLTPDEFPNDLKRRLLDLASRLPESERTGFIVRVSEKIVDLADSYRDTILFAAMGWVLGELLDHIFVVDLPFTEAVLSLTGDHASEVGVFGGLLAGFWSDCKRAEARKQIAEAIARELRTSLRGC